MKKAPSGKKKPSLTGRKVSEEKCLKGKMPPRKKDSEEKCLRGKMPSRKKAFEEKDIFANSFEIYIFMCTILYLDIPEIFFFDWHGRL